MNVVYNIDFPPDQFWFSTLNTVVLWMVTLSSALFIVSMTFDRFYSIIRPHKAASFNTVKRAKITILCIFIFSILVNVPHLFTTDLEGRQSVPFGRGMDKLIGRFYYWVSFAINFAIPFVTLLIMNSVIIHTLRKRPRHPLKQNTKDQGRSQCQGRDQGYSSKIKNLDTQIFFILLLVTFAFLILTTPAYAFFLYVMFVNYTYSPQRFAGFHLFYNVAHKLYYTNYGINFYLYVMSGQKFRSDLLKLFKRSQNSIKNNLFHDLNINISTIERN